MLNSCIANTPSNKRMPDSLSRTRAPSVYAKSPCGKRLRRMTASRPGPGAMFAITRIRYTRRPMIRGIDHVNFRTDKLPELVRFYTEVLGFSEGERPPFGNEGAWLYANGEPLIHISVSDDPHGGSTLPIDHIALDARDIERTLSNIIEAGLRFEVYNVPGRRMRQVFIEDPQGVSIELNFSDPQDQDAPIPKPSL